MASAEEAGVKVGRREDLKMMAMTAVTATCGPGVLASDRASAAAGPPRAEGANTPGGSYNILFILTDQERHFRPGDLPKDYRLPAHERLARKGIVFENHRINSCVCTPSRSVVYTGWVATGAVNDV
jgi:hypothetical protein